MCTNNYKLNAMLSPDREVAVKSVQDLLERISGPNINKLPTMHKRV